jgi:hypothetical protein
MPSTVPIPTIQFSAWNNTELANPIGTRHLVSGSFAYTKLLGTGCSNAMTFGNLTLDLANNDPYASSDVVVLNFCVPNFDTLVASGLSTVNNFRLWLPSGSGTASTHPGVSLQYYINSSWLPNLTFPSGFGQTFSSTIPLTANVARIDGQLELLAYNDSNVSQWIYMRLFADSSLPVGTYGICGSGLLRPRLTFDFY